jgi:LysM repeat protein
MAGLRRLVTAAFVVTILFAGTGRETVAQQRYRVQPGDTLASVAAEFGVDPDAILASSWIADPPNLQPGDIIVIPDPSQSPEDAAKEAAAHEGTSPWVAAAYDVKDGDTIESIAASFGVDVGALAAFNGLDNPNLLDVGQRLLIPAKLDDATGEPVDGIAASGANAANTPPQWVPTHQQERNLSCEYASAFIATSAFGKGIPEQVFIDEVPKARNPHYGYRGNIDGAWGGYDDYGVYPEALVPVLNEWGFAGDVFYSMGDPTPLKNHLDAGHAVMVWMALWGDTGVRYHDDDSYTVFAGEHVMVAYAYDGNGVYLSDPAHGTYKFMNWDTFRYVWGTSDGMSLAVYPM